MRLDISPTRDLFGPPAALYGPIVADVIPRVTHFTYRFWENESVFAAFDEGRIGVKELNCIAVAEVLISAHLAAATSLVRASRWFEASWREYEAKNLLGWAACCRALLEAVGDTIDGLGTIGADIAENLSLFIRALTGFEDGLLNLAPLEDKVIHFSHARKIARADRNQVPSTHVARQTYEYIALLKSAGLAGPAALYAELCEISHPASRSVSWMHETEEGGFRINSDGDSRAIAGLVAEHRDDLHFLPSLAFNPGLLILRVLTKFGLFPNVPELRNFSFQGAPGWVKIKQVLATAPPTLRSSALLDKVIAATVARPPGEAAS